MALSTFLREAGYQQVALTRSAVGHFHTGGTLNGRRVDVLLDMGAASTVVSLAVGAGAWDYTQQTRPDRRRSRRSEPRDSRARRCEALARRSAAAAAGATGDGPDSREPIARAERRSTGRCHSRRGCIEAQAAVIDYGSSSLFLKP